jgi:hypothetical protein
MNETEQAIAAIFHARRAEAKKRKVSDGARRIAEAALERVRSDERASGDGS